MREFSLDMDKITKKKSFVSKVFVSTCLHCFNAATPLKCNCVKSYKCNCVKGYKCNCKKL